MRTLNELDETNNQLIEINDSVMQALAKTIDAKDKYTKGHSESGKVQQGNLGANGQVEERTG